MADLLTSAEACAFLKLKHPSTLRRWRKAGRLPVVKLSNGTVRYRVSDLEKLAAASLRWDQAPPERQDVPRPITTAPSWLDPDAVHPITGVRYGDAISGGRG